MYCSRNNIVPGKSGDSCCQQCGKELVANTGKGRKALFCSSNCRITYWRKMKEKDRNYITYTKKSLKKGTKYNFQCADIIKDANGNVVATKD